MLGSLTLKSYYMSNLEARSPSAKIQTFYQIITNWLLDSCSQFGISPPPPAGIAYWQELLDVKFIAVIQAILYAGKQLQQLHIEDEDNSNNMRAKTVHSGLLRKLILTASSSSVIGNAAKMLSTLNKEAADENDLQNLIIISNGQFPEVCYYKGFILLINSLSLSLLYLALFMISMPSWYGLLCIGC